MPNTEDAGKWRQTLRVIERICTRYPSLCPAVCAAARRGREQAELYRVSAENEEAVQEGGRMLRELFVDDGGTT